MSEIDTQIKTNIDELIKLGSTKKANKRVISLLEIALSIFDLYNTQKGKI